jgi:hypothetical protein
MNRFSTTLITALFLLYACKSKSGHSGSASDIQFKVDTSQIRAMDSVAASQRRTDSELLRKADSTPGNNAGADNFDIKTPTGWQRKDTLIGTIKTIMLSTPSPSIKFRTTVSVVSGSMNGLTLDQYEQLSLNNMAKYIDHFALMGQGERTIGDCHARWLHYSQSPDGLDLENILYIITDKGVAYLITCSALKGHLLQNHAAFEQAITSFRLHQ